MRSPRKKQTGSQFLLPSKTKYHFQVDSRLRCQKQNYKNVEKPYRNSSVTSGQEHFLREKVNSIKEINIHSLLHALFTKGHKMGNKEKPESEKLYTFLKNILNIAS